jgi:hypothetical protein
MSDRKYRPSNGTEGEYFISEFCQNCIHDNPDYDAKSPRCDILTLTMCLDASDPNYPSEWVYDENDRPTCTKFVKWDWDNDGDPGDPDNPLAPIPVSDNQLVMPFLVSDIEQSIIAAAKNPELVYQ